MAILSLARHGWDALFATEHAGQAFAIAYFLCSVILVPALIVLRRRYRRLSQTTQWSLSSVGVMLTALAFAVLITGQ